MKIRLSSRDVIEDKFKEEAFSADNKIEFRKNLNAGNLATELYYAGYKDVASISEQFKERNLKLDSEVKDIIKKVIEKLSSSNKTK